MTHMERAAVAVADEMPPDIEKNQHPVEAVDDERHSSDNSTSDRYIRPGRKETRRPAVSSISRTTSRQSNRSRRSYGGLDGYSIHHEDDADGSDSPSPSDGKRNPEFEVLFDGPNDPMNPKSRGKAQKWLITLIVCSGSFCTTCTSASYTQIYGQIGQEWGTSRELATAGLSLYIIGLGLGPMFLAPLSEWWGRRPIYIASFAMFIVWLVPCAVAQNIETILVARFFGGIAGSAFLSVAGGTVSDMFDRSELSLPMMAYTAAPFLGPEIGPVIGGFINQFSNWRWTFYSLIIWSGLQFLAIVLLVPETYHPVCLKKKAIKMRNETGNQEWYAAIEVMDKSVTMTVLWSCIRPFQLLVFEPMCLFLCLISAVLLGIIYLSFGSFILIFRNNHGFNQWQSGMTFLGIFVGMIIGIACDSYWKNWYTRLTDKNGGVSEPEFRLPSTIIGAVIVPVSLIGFAFTTYPQVPWIVPILFSGFFGIGNIFCFSGIFTNHVETYPLYAASALAANSFVRSSFAAAFPLFGNQMFEALGYQWASFLLAGVALLLMPFPYIFFKYGKQIRGKSRFAVSPK